MPSLAFALVGPCPPLLSPSSDAACIGSTLPACPPRLPPSVPLPGSLPPPPPPYARINSPQPPAITLPPSLGFPTLASQKPIPPPQSLPRRLVVAERAGDSSPGSGHSRTHLSAPQNANIDHDSDDELGRQGTDLAGSMRNRGSAQAASLDGGVMPSGSPRLSNFHIHRTQVAGIGQGSRHTSRKGSKESVLAQKRDYREKRKSKDKKGKKAKDNKKKDLATLSSSRDIGKESVDELASSAGMRRQSIIASEAPEPDEELFPVRVALHAAPAAPARSARPRCPLCICSSHAACPTPARTCAAQSFAQVIFQRADSLGDGLLDRHEFQAICESPTLSLNMPADVRWQRRVAMAAQACPVRLHARLICACPRPLAAAGGRRSLYRGRSRQGRLAVV